MNAVILAGGFGSRLMPLTQNTIKPMLPLANMPMIDYTVSHLADAGIDDCVFTLSHKPEQVIEWAAGYTALKSHFSIETSPLGTLGGVKAAQKMLSDTFVVMSGDALENVDLSAMLQKHRELSADITMAVKRVENTHLYGVVETDSQGLVTGFTEKPPLGEENSKLVNTGIYIVNKNILKRIPKFVRMDFSKDLFPLLLKEGRIATYFHNGYWCDIGDVSSYYRANFDVKDGGFYLRPFNRFRTQYASCHVGAEPQTLTCVSSTLVGEVRGSIIGRGCRIAASAQLDNCIVMDNTVVTDKYYNSIIGQDFALSVSNIDINNFEASEILNSYQFFS